MGGEEKGKQERRSHSKKEKVEGESDREKREDQEEKL